MNRALPLALAALLTAGCLPDTKKLDPFASAASVCPVLFDVVTAKLAECGGYAPYQTSLMYAGAVRSCGVIAAAEKAGRIGYDRAKAEACIDAINAPGCGSLDNACSDLPFVPRVAPGGDCGNDLECTAASAGCFSPTLTCPGKCLQVGSVAGTSRCYSNVDPPCASNLWCDSSGVTPTCRARAADGAACTSIPCGTASFCDFSATPYTCKPQVGVGVACTGSGQCSDAQNLFCDSATGKCAAANPASTTRCDYPNQCAPNLWCDYSTSPNPTCKARLANGVAGCTSSNACLTPGAGCIMPSGAGSGTCQTLKTEGAACTQGDDECQRGLSCTLVTGSTPKCTRWPGQGGACGSIGGEFVSCADGTYCDRLAGAVAGTCKPTVAPGAACPTYNECSGDGFGFSRTQCISLPSTGALTCVAPCAPF
jgi:hypothetical protein